MRIVSTGAARVLPLMSTCMVLAACSTDGATFTANGKVSGTVSGLSGRGPVLENSDSDDLTVSANGTITFVSARADGAMYNMVLRTQPTRPAQVCTVTRGSGASPSDVIDVAAVCTTNSYIS